jgi:putative MATE family efflux protein
MGILVKDRRFYRSLFSLAGVIALQNLVSYGVNMADNIMVGGYSQDALNGVAIVNQIQFFLQLFAGGTATGIAVIAAQYWGLKKVEPIKRVYAVGLWLGIIVSAALTAIVFIIPEKVLWLLTNETAVIAEGTKYLRIVCFTYVIFTITTILIGVLRSVETVRIGFYVSLASLFVNVALNYCMIYGEFGFPELGIRGAAIATLISRIVEFLVIIGYIRFRDKKLHLKLRDAFIVNRIYIRDYVKTGLPLVLSNSSWGIAMSVQTAIIGRLGAAAISANSIATTLFQFVTVGVYGLASATSVIIGKTVGEERYDDVRQYAKTLQILFICIGVITSLLLYGAKQIIVDFYKVSPDSAALAHSFILVLCVTVIGTAYQMSSLTGIVSGGGQTNFVLFNDIIFMWGIVLPASALSAFVFKSPPVITFICLKSDQVLKCAVAVVKVNRFRWIRNVTRKDEAKA